MQNCLARVVTKASRFNLSLPFLKQLDWRPVKIHFKLCIMMFRTLRENQPAYLTGLLVWSKYLCSTNLIHFLFPLKLRLGQKLSP